MPPPHAKREEYLALRARFEPASIKLVIIAESPPENGTYFYNPAGLTTEWLFSALMQQLSFSADSKELGLREFQQRGWLLVDATYKPVNGLTRSERRTAILSEYHLLFADLENMLLDKSTPIILIKENVCRHLETILKDDGFRVLNCGQIVYFPSNHHQREFHRQFESILERARLRPPPLDR